MFGSRMRSLARVKNDFERSVMLKSTPLALRKVMISARESLQFLPGMMMYAFFSGSNVLTLRWVSRMHVMIDTPASDSCRYFSVIT